VNLGVAFTVSVAFDNTDASATGYGPYVDIPLDYTGVDGVYDTGTGSYTDTVDGISVASSGAVTLLGSPVVYHLLTFNDTLNGGLGIPHPYAVTTSGTPVYLLTTDFGSGRFQNGDQLLVALLPFGSFTPEQPAATLAISATLSNLADMGTALNLSARGGFQYGADPLANPSTDPTITGTRADSSLQPSLITLTKTCSAPESETATGPNFSRTFTVTLDIATGQQTTFAEIRDTLPTNLQFVSLVSITENFPEASTVDGANQSTPNTSTPGGALQRRLLPSGATYFTAVAGADVVMTYTAFVPRLNAASAAVINAATGDDATSVNDACGEIYWNPIDAHDPDVSVVSDATPSDCTLSDRSIAIQKGVALVTDTGAPGYSPGDTIEYTLNFQVSDYFAFQNLVVTDTYTDGQRVDGSYTPTLSVTEHGNALPVAAFAAGNWSTANLTNGIANDSLPDATYEGGQELTFSVSAELIARAADGRLLGGGVEDPFAELENNPPLPYGGTTGTIRFRCVIQDTYRERYPSGENSVNGNDSFGNIADIDGDVLQVGLTVGDPNHLTPTGSAEADGTSADFTTVWRQPDNESFQRRKVGDTRFGVTLMA